jgi:hypothetical protein
MLVAFRSDRGQGRGGVLRFEASLSETGRLEVPFSAKQLHEIAWHDGKLWVTCTSHNMIGIFDRGAWKHWYPMGLHASDVFHFNSLGFSDGKVWILAHCWGASELFSFSYPGFALLSRAPIGRCAHNIRQLEGETVVCSSADGQIIGDLGLSVDVGDWPRGLAISRDEACVGVSALANREVRQDGDSRLVVMSRDWSPKKTIPLIGEGMVLDVCEYPGAVAPSAF